MRHYLAAATLLAVALGPIDAHAAAPSACWESCPRSQEPLRQLDNRGFSLGYSANMRQSLWVAYRLQPLPKGRAAPWYRRGRFAADPRIDQGPDAWALRGSGYDRGHLAPAFLIGVLHGKRASTASYWMSNISPQSPRLNRLLMQRFEEVEVEVIAQLPGALWAYGGPVFAAKPERVGKNIALPEQFFRAWLWRRPNGELSVCSFLLPQTAQGEEPLRGFATPLGAIESRSKIKLLPDLPAVDKRGNCGAGWPLDAINHWPARYAKDFAAP